jgi:hypothetical protein
LDTNSIKKLDSKIDELLDIKINANEWFHEQIKKDTKIGKKYRISTFVNGIKGEEYCGFFGIIMSDGKKKYGRYIRWLNDFSGNGREIEIVFKAAFEFVYITCVINTKEIPVRANCHIRLLPLNKIKFEQVSDNEDDSYDSEEVQINSEELTHDEEDILERNLVWVFSMPRSGTTWFATRLLSYENHTMDEPKITREIITDENFVARRNSVDYFLSNQYSEEWKPLLRKMILNRIYMQFRDLSNYIIIKEPHGSFADIISDCMPKSRIIVLLRDGRDVLDSKMDGYMEGGWISQKAGKVLTEQKRLEFLENEAKAWKYGITSLMKIRENHSEELTYVVRYEDLRLDTVPVLKKVYGFLNKDISDEKLQELVDRYSFENIPRKWQGSGKVVRSASPGKWKENFTEDEIKILNEIMMDKLKEMGYS